MEYNSFYGGRRGASFIIVRSFKDIPTMVNYFSNGGNYTEVNYDEYVIINTVNKNHPDNGKIFRRGYDYNSSRTIVAYRAYDENNNEIIDGEDQDYTTAHYVLDTNYIAGGAIYIGTIVGPAGRSPMLTLTTYAIAEAKHASEGFDELKNSGEYVINTDLLPGKYIENNQIKYNDSIKWYSTSLKNEYDQDTEVYLGFKIPYHVIDYTTTSVAPYNNHEYTDTSAAERIDDGTHPFYEHWNLSIPTGVKGDALKNFRVIVPTAQDIIYEVDTRQIYPGFEDDVEGGRSILVYDYYNYDDVDNPTAITYYIGDYNQISDFTIANNGTITIALTHDNTITYSNLIRWITNITLNQDLEGNDAPGHLIIYYNTEHTETIEEEGQEQGQTITTTQIVQDKVEYDLNWVNDIVLSDSGQLTLKYSGNGQDEVITTDSKFIKWITDISMDSLGVITITYNNGDTDSFTDAIKWVTSVEFNDNGDVTVNYNDGTADTYERELKWITDVSLDDEGNFDITYSQDVESYHTQLTWPTEININTTDSSGNEGTGDQKVYVTYTTSEDPVPIGNPLNYIMKMRVTSDFHLIALYSDPAKRQAVINERKDYRTSSTPMTIDGYTGWLDLGSIHSDSGIFIGLNMTSNAEGFTGDITSYEDVISYLNTKYPSGLTGTDLTGKIVSAGDTDQGKDFYGFDYSYASGTSDYNGWYYLGSFQNAPICVAKDDGSIDTQSKTSALQNGGVWLIIDSVYTITYNLTNVTSSNMATSIVGGNTYETRLSGGATRSVTVTMGGVDITASNYSATTGWLYISPNASTSAPQTVTGNIVITATAT